jgi:hypothetical protein
VPYGCRNGVEVPYAASRGLASGKAVNELLVLFGEELTVFLAIGNLPLPVIQHPLLGGAGGLDVTVCGPLVPAYVFRS